MRVKRRLTAIEFEAVRPYLKHMAPARIEAARAVLVDGQSLAAVGRINDCTRQAVADMVNSVWVKVEDYRESQRTTANAGKLLPPGWEEVTLIAPTELIPKFREAIALAAADPSPAPPLDAPADKKKPGAVKRRALKST